MILSGYAENLFYLDIFLHLEFAFIVSAIIFHLIFAENEEEKIKKLLEETLKTNILESLSKLKDNDKENLKKLRKIYDNEDKNDSVLKYLKKSSWTAIILIVIIIIIVILQLKNDPNIVNILLDKFLLFACIFLGLYLQEKLIGDNFHQLFEKDIYEMLRKNLNKLTDKE